MVGDQTDNELTARPGVVEGSMCRDRRQVENFHERGEFVVRQA